MSLSIQFRPMRRCVFSGFALCCAAALIGCGGSEEPATTDSGASADPAGESPTSGAPPKQGISTTPGGTTSGDASMPAGDGASATGMSSAAGGSSTMMSAPGMSSAPGGSSAMSSTPGMAGMSAGYPGGGAPNSGEPNGAYAGDGYTGEGSTGGQLAVKTPRPDSFDAWTDADFQSAAREHDPRVLDAIDFKVKSAPGDGSVAVLLTSLLDLPPLPVQTNANGAAAGYPGTTGAPTAGSAYPGSAYPGAATPGAAGSGSSAMQGRSVPGSAPASAPASAPSSAPQSSMGKPANRYLSDSAADPRGAVDSVSAMILEAAVSYMPQGAAVGAVAGGAAGRIEGLTGQAPGSTSIPGAMPAGAMPAGYPGGANPGGEYPGGGYSGGDQTSGGTPNAGQLQDKLLVEKVVDGLIANNSQEAWQSVFGIVAGTVKTPLPNAANCEIVVERLVQNMDSSPDVIQPVILAFLDPVTDLPPQSRTACMRMLAAISATQTNALTGFGITETPPATAPGAAGGYPGGTSGYPGSTGEGEGGVTGAAAAGYPGMNGLGGQPGMIGGQPGMNGQGNNEAVGMQSSLPHVSLAPEVAARGASFLWSPKTIAAIVGQLEKATDLATASDVLLLASTIPGAGVRNAICETFIRLHPSGSMRPVCSAMCMIRECW